MREFSLCNNVPCVPPSFNTISRVRVIGFLLVSACEESRPSTPVAATPAVTQATAAPRETTAAVLPATPPVTPKASPSPQETVARDLLQPSVMSKAESAAILEAVVAMHGGNEDSVWSVQPRPKWVRYTRWKPERDDNATIALADIQVSFVGPRPQRYHRVIYRNRTVEEMRNHRAIRLDFLPPNQRLELHAAQVHRGKQIISQINPFTTKFVAEKPKTVPQKVGLPRTYVEYEPSLTIHSELQLGDLLEVEYTVYGLGDPRLEVRSQARLTFPSVLESADLHRLRVLADPDEPPLQIRRHATTIEPQTKRIGGKTEYVWQVKDTPPAEEKAGSTLPGIEFGNYGDWEDIAALTRPLYESDAATPELKAIVAEISGKNVDQAAQVRAALDHVQHKLAFSSANLGKWTSEPRPIADTLRRRVGDCKGKSVVLRAILRELGVASELVLVNLEGADLREVMPGPSKVDHVILAVRIDNREVFLDPTRQGDRGDLWSMPRLTFRTGLSLAPGRGILDIPHPCDDLEPMTATTLHYHLGAPGQPARVDFARTIRELTAADAEKSFRENFAGASPNNIGQNLSGRVGIPHVTDDLRHRDDPIHDAVILTTNMVLSEIWRRDVDGGPIAKLGPSYMDQDLAWVFPRKLLIKRDWTGFHRVDTVIDLPHNATVKSESFEFTLPGFRVTHKVTVRERQVITRSDVHACTRQVTDPDAIFAALPGLARRMRIEVRATPP